MKFSIIIINYKTKELTAKCIKSIYRFCDPADFEILIVDNNSGDGSLEYLRQEIGGQAQLIANPDNAGFGRANNLAAGSATGEYLFLLNSDTYLKENILAFIYDYLDSHDDVDIVSPLLRLDDGNRQEHAYGRFPSVVSTLFRHNRNIDLNQCNGNVDWVSGAALIIRKSTFDRLGGFDRNYFMYFEDIDLCRAVKKSGQRIVVLDNISVVHIGGASESDSRLRKKMYYVSQDHYFAKNHGRLARTLIRLARFFYLRIKGVRLD